MILYILLLLIGLVVIYYGGEIFVTGSIELAEILGWSKLIIGVVILGFGTSAPEIAISIFSALKGHADIVLGNILGSNVTNVLLVLGLSLFIKPIREKFHISYVYSVLIIVSAVLFFYGLYVQDFARWLGFLMLLIAAVSAYAMIQVERKKNSEKEVKHHYNIYFTLLKLIGGLILLILSSHLIIHGVVKISEAMGISKTVIAASIVALGTSLPELVLSIIAAKKGHFELVLGNIIGSNVSNILLGVGLAVVVEPFANLNIATNLSLAAFIGSTVLLLLLTNTVLLRRRFIGALSVLAYIGFIILLYVTI